MGVDEGLGPGVVLGERVAEDGQDLRPDLRVSESLPNELRGGGHVII